MAKGTVSGVDTQDALGNVAIGGGAAVGVTTGVGNSIIGCAAGDARVLWPTVVSLCCVALVDGNEEEESSGNGGQE